MEPEDTQDQRIARARTYLDEHLEGQQGWYDRKATRNKLWHMRLGLVIIAAGAATAVVQIWSPSPPDSPVHWIAVLTALLGMSVVIAKGVDRLWGFDENWSNYRQASEAMKREMRMYVNRAGPYVSVSDGDEAYRLFVERVEAIIAAEQHAFWEQTPQKGDKSSD